MAQQEGQQRAQGTEIVRIFEQPADAMTAYSDFAQVLGTGSEVVLQFYETVPDLPGPNGQIQNAFTQFGFGSGRAQLSCTRR
jgi:hypothetical protein